MKAGSGRTRFAQAECSGGALHRSQGLRGARWPCQFNLRSNPDPSYGGTFFDDTNPVPQRDMITGYGCLGFNEPGSVTCPGNGEAGACCVGQVCTFVCAVFCQGVYMGDFVPCVPNPCVGPGGHGVSYERSTWPAAWWPAGDGESRPRALWDTEHGAGAAIRTVSSHGRWYHGWVNLYEEFFQIIAAFQKAGIRHAVVGGLALAFYDLPRFTRDIDLLVHPDDVPRISTILEPLSYEQSTNPWTFERTQVTVYRYIKTEGDDHMVLDILVGGQPRHLQTLEAAADQPWARGTVKVVRKEDLIWLKEQRGSEQDRLDIRRLQGDQD